MLKPNMWSKNVAKDLAKDVDYREEAKVEQRVAKLETHVSHMQADISEIKSDIREMRGDLSSVKTDLTDLKIQMLEGFGRLRMSDIMTRIWMLMGLAAVLGVMARGFKWI